MTPFSVVDCSFREITGVIVHGEKFFNARDIAASLGYAPSKAKDKNTGWQWVLYKQMPDRFKFDIKPRKGRTVHFYSVGGILWLETRVKSTARRKAARALRADFYDWFYKTFPAEIQRVKQDNVYVDNPCLYTGMKLPY